MKKSFKINKNYLSSLKNRSITTGELTVKIIKSLCHGWCGGFFVIEVSNETGSAIYNIQQCSFTEMCSKTKGFHTDLYDSEINNFVFYFLEKNYKSVDIAFKHFDQTPKIEVLSIEKDSTKTHGSLIAKLDGKIDMLYYSTSYGETTFEPHHGHFDDFDYGSNNWNILIESITKL
jgi:hypothetical protein